MISWKDVRRPAELTYAYIVVSLLVGVRSEEATSPDIYQSAQVTRQIYAVRAHIEPGNSGGPLLSPGGRVYGVVFAAAISVRDTGYALTASEVQSDARRGANATVGVSTQGCD